MENLINWIEIPVKDLTKAASFYQAILDIEIKEMDMFGTKMGLFPTDGSNVSGALVQGDNYTPSKDGVLAYLNGGNDLQIILDRIEAQQGTVIMPKTQISPEMGYFALFIDTEGNKVALHSPN